MGHYASEMDPHWGWTKEDYRRQHEQRDMQLDTIQTVALDLARLAVNTEVKLSLPLLKLVVGTMQFGNTFMHSNEYIGHSRRNLMEIVSLSLGDSALSDTRDDRDLLEAYDRMFELEKGDTTDTYSLDPESGNLNRVVTSSLTRTLTKIPEIPMRWVLADHVDIDGTAFEIAPATEIDERLEETGLFDTGRHKLVVSTDGNPLWLKAIYARNRQDKGQFLVSNANGDFIVATAAEGENDSRYIRCVNQVIHHD